jgi:DNA polymerase-3 subunit epsilon
VREIIFDTETTGLDAREDRIIEIGGIELVNRFPTGRTFHKYINPQGRQIHPDAQAVHGISADDLAGKPVFPEIAEEFMAFVEGAKLVAHNANFDINFINAEFARLGHPPVASELVVDTLALAKRKHPMGPNSLDALCRRYGIDNSHRTKHGALLDSELLAEVYIELIGGKQVSTETAEVSIGARPSPLPSRLSEADRAAHSALVDSMGEKAVWLQVADRAAT